MNQDYKQTIESILVPVSKQFREYYYCNSVIQDLKKKKLTFAVVQRKDSKGDLFQVWRAPVEGDLPVKTHDSQDGENRVIENTGPSEESIIQLWINGEAVIEL